MCQLLGMNCNIPTDICFSFEGFSARGGATDNHSDGWGIAFFEGRGCRLFLDSKSTQESPLAEWVRSYPIHSKNVIAHIRKATLGEVALQNSHPFMRELWGRYWIFAHNGTLNNCGLDGGKNYQAVGETDSERAFCYILSQLRERFPGKQPGDEALFVAVREITAKLVAYGDFNYLLSNGQWLFAHCATRLSYVLRRAPFATAHLIDQDITIDFSEHTREQDRVAVIATVPLTDNEEWVTIAPGELLLFREGELAARF